MSVHEPASSSVCRPTDLSCCLASEPSAIPHAREHESPHKTSDPRHPATGTDPICPSQHHSALTPSGGRPVRSRLVYSSPCPGSGRLDMTLDPRRAEADMPPSVIPPSRAAAFLGRKGGTSRSGNVRGLVVLGAQSVSLPSLSRCTLERIWCAVTMIYTIFPSIDGVSPVADDEEGLAEGGRQVAAVRVIARHGPVRATRMQRLHTCRRTEGTRVRPGKLANDGPSITGPLGAVYDDSSHTGSTPSHVGK